MSGNQTSKTTRAFQPCRHLSREKKSWGLCYECAAKVEEYINSALTREQNEVQVSMEVYAWWEKHAPNYGDAQLAEMLADEWGGYASHYKKLLDENCSGKLERDQMLEDFVSLALDHN